MGKIYVIDTTSLISYFHLVFKEKPKISKSALDIIDKVLNYKSNNKLIIPSIVFIEIFSKWHSEEELAAKINYEIYQRVMANPNIEIKPIEREVVENLVKIDINKISENHDRIILASAISMNSPLITSDNKIINYVKKNKIIPNIIS